MPKSHESKLFVTATYYHSGAVRLHVHRTRRAAREFRQEKLAAKSVAACHVRPATWGPDR